MKIKEIGGEFELLKRVVKTPATVPGVVVGIGDDCAVLEFNDHEYHLVTTDMMVENDHFSCKWFTPDQIGRKLMESNVSDIIAMGGTPEFAFLSMSIRKDTDVEFMDGFYRGLYESAGRHNVFLAGGDTTHGTEYVFNLTLMGRVEKGCLRLRSMAVPGDLIGVTGMLGGSTAGLKLLLRGKDGYFDDHLEPRSRTEQEGKLIARYVHAMIDVSDGLGSEVTHICDMSNTGAEIFHDKIPLSNETIASAKSLNDDPYDYALYGGEDFEIVFTIPENKIEDFRTEFKDFTIVGRITGKEAGICIIKDNKRLPVKKGYDHFA